MLSVEVRGQLPVYGDGMRLEQVLNNVLLNAARYTEDGGAVSLIACEEDGQAAIRVKDNGRGIRPEMMPRIFELFGQGNDPFVRSAGGLGIGLTIVKKLVEMHGGTVTASSDGPGKGSEFVIRLPLSRLPEQAAETTDGPVIQRALRFLIAEDNKDTALMTAALLEEQGHSVQVVFDGISAIEGALSAQPDVMLLDLGLPDISGFEAAAAIRKKSKRTPLIIAVSGYGQEKDLRQARDAGIDHHLLKPLDYFKLAALLANEGF